MDDDDKFVRPGLRIGPWTLVKRGGQSSEAWLARDADGQLATVTFPTLRPGRGEPVSWLDAAQVIEAARAQARLEHPNVVRVLEVRELDGVPAVVSSPGLRLSVMTQLLPEPSDDVADAVIRDVAAGLGAIHEAGLVHGFLRAPHVLLTDGGERVVAQVDGVGRDLPTIFDRPTPPIAPECIRGAPADVRSDVFALGVLAFLLLEGRLPFPGVTDEEVATATLSGRYGPMREIPDPMAAAIDGALRVDPRHRTANVADFLALWTDERPEPPVNAALLEAVRSFSA